METIKIYLDNMFTSLPKTDQMLKVKNDLLSNMEDKYNEHKNNGKSENEAIGIVISEFGNIDELINELGIEYKNHETTLLVVTQEEADSFIAAKKVSGLLVSIGTFLCIIAAAMLILISTLVDAGIIGKGVSKDLSDIFGLIVLLIIIAPAVALFIYSGMKLEKFKYLKNDFDLPLNVKVLLEQKHNAFAKQYMVSLIIGVCLCVLSPVAIFVSSAYGDNGSSYGVVVLLIVISIAVFLFIYFGSIRESFSILLKTNDFSKEKTQNNKAI